MVVVDDASEDDSVERIQAFPCRLVRMAGRVGVSRARNAGARASSGELLFFIDSDCLLERDALSTANASYGRRTDLVLGGTYTPIPHDDDFFSAFQSISVSHFETKNPRPDYVAAHAMVVDAKLFERSGGFGGNSFMGVDAAVEDVELCHRLRRAGCELAMDPGLRVKHVFRFSLARSLRNAFRKSRTWTRYSLVNRDLLADSGAASLELKTNVLSCAAAAVLLAGAAVTGSVWPLLGAASLLAMDLSVNRGLVAAWSRTKGWPFSALAVLYYTTLYAAAVGVGAALGAAQHLRAARSARGLS